MSKKKEEFEGLDIFGSDFDPNMKAVSNEVDEDPIVELPEEEVEEEQEESPEEVDTETVETEEEEVEEETPSVDEEESDLPTSEELSEIEPAIAEYVQEKLYEELGWTVGDEDGKFESISDIVKYMQELVEENSKPQFANEDVKKLNDFVANGGGFNDYFTSVGSEINLDKVDIKRKGDQISVLKSLYKEQGLSEDKINKRIERYDDTGVLEEEAEEGLDLLKNIQEKKVQKRLDDQRKVNEDRVKQQQKFYTDVTSNIRSKKDIFGTVLPATKKEQLIKDIFEVDASGVSKYQKKYAESPEENLILSAYVTMYKDDILKGLGKKATTDATKKLKSSLQNMKGKKNKSDATSSVSSKSSSLLDIFS